MSGFLRKDRDFYHYKDVMVSLHASLIYPEEKSSKIELCLENCSFLTKELADARFKTRLMQMDAASASVETNQAVREAKEAIKQFREAVKAEAQAPEETKAARVRAEKASLGASRLVREATTARYSLYQAKTEQASLESTENTLREIVKEHRLPRSKIMRAQEVKLELCRDTGQHRRYARP